jgi:cytochrome P450
MPLPPGPRTPALLQTMQIMREPLGFAQRHRARFGDVFTARMVGRGPSVYVGTPALAEQVFKASPDVLHAGSGNAILAPFVGERSLLTSDGPQHRSRRKLMTPPFHGERMRSYAGIVEEAAKAACAGWSGDVQVLPAFEDLTLDVIVRAVYGFTDERVAEQKARIAKTLQALTPPIIFFPALRRDLGAWSPWGRYRRASEAADERLRAEFARRREHPDPEAVDVLSMLLATTDEDGQPLSDQELRDHMVTLLAAGHITTAVALTWAVLEVFRRPDLVERLRAEVDTCETAVDASKNPWITAVVKESLRLHPPVPVALREVAQPFRLGEHELEPGTRLVVAGMAMQNDPELWDDVERFEPERWIDRKPPPYAYLPFGGGTRRCLGEALAMFELKIALATVAELPLVAPAKLPGTVRHNLTLAPAGLGRVRVG